MGDCGLGEGLAEALGALEDWVEGVELGLGFGVGVGVGEGLLANVMNVTDVEFGPVPTELTAATEIETVTPGCRPVRDGDQVTINRRAILTITVMHHRVIITTEQIDDGR